MEININGKPTTVYPALSEELNLIFIPGSLNGFYGLNHYCIQVLKSAAGFYIGTLTKSNYAEKNEWPEYHWEPNSRDSQEYFSKREDAELALINQTYTIKF